MTNIIIQFRVLNVMYYNIASIYLANRTVNNIMLIFSGSEIKMKQMISFCWPESLFKTY